NGDGTFQPARSFIVSNNPGGSPLSLVAGDFDEDGRSDLGEVWSNGLVVQRIEPDGTLQHATTVVRVAGTQTGPQALWAVGDFTGDGHLDFATVVPVTDSLNAFTGHSEVSVLLGKGDSTFAPARNSDLSPGYPVALLTGNFTGSGRSELAVQDG